MEIVASCTLLNSRASELDSKTPTSIMVKAKKNVFFFQETAVAMRRSLK
jgi:hypothetical protein